MYLFNSSWSTKSTNLFKKDCNSEKILMLKNFHKFSEPHCWFCPSWSVKVWKLTLTEKNLKSNQKQTTKTSLNGWWDIFEDEWTKLYTKKTCMWNLIFCCCVWNLSLWTNTKNYWLQKWIVKYMIIYMSMNIFTIVL